MGRCYLVFYLHDYHRWRFLAAVDWLEPNRRLAIPFKSAILAADGAAIANSRQIRWVSMGVVLRKLPEAL